jgi:hypothetical protein
VTAGFGMREGMFAAGMARVMPLLNIMRYWGEETGSSEMSINVPARFCPKEELMSRTRVPGGYGLLMVGLLLQWRETKRPPLY